MCYCACGSYARLSARSALSIKQLKLAVRAPHEIRDVYRIRLGWLRPIPTRPFSPEVKGGPDGGARHRAYARLFSRYLVRTLWRNGIVTGPFAGVLALSGHMSPVGPTAPAGGVRTKRCPDLSGHVCHGPTLF